MEKRLKIVLVFISLLILATQYQNCQNRSDGAFWDAASGGDGTVTQYQQAAITSASVNVLSPQDFFEISGVCNPGLGNTGLMTYSMFTSTDFTTDLMRGRQLYSTAVCDSGRFTFLVPIVPKLPCSQTSASCRYVIRAQMNIGTISVNLPEYSFRVANF